MITKTKETYTVETSEYIFHYDYRDKQLHLVDKKKFAVLLHMIGDEVKTDHVSIDFDLYITNLESALEACSLITAENYTVTNEEGEYYFTSFDDAVFFSAQYGGDVKPDLVRDIFHKINL